MNAVADILLLRRPFYFLRHGEAESNLRGLVSGTTDVPLTARGHEQARAAAAALKDRGITTIYSSALQRARDTAEYAARSLGLPVVVVPELAERNWGVLNGQPRGLRKPGVTPPGAETPEIYAARVGKGLAAVTGDVPLIVAHSGVFRVLCKMLGVPEPRDPVTNARAVLCLPPDAAHAVWRFEFI
jgi:probable phosphoglycerate mutase